MRKVEEITISSKEKDLESSFSRTALNMFDVVVDTNEIVQNITKTFFIKAKNTNELLYLFLKKLYDSANSDLFIPASVKNIKIDMVGRDFFLDAVLSGDMMRPGYKIKDIVKQVTNRNILIKEDKNGVLTQINIVVERRKNEGI